VRNWFAQNKKPPGWFAASLNDAGIEFARGKFATSGAAAIAGYGSRPLAEKNALHKLGNELHLERSKCATLLEPGDYQLLLVEAPNVPKAELRSAIRWKVKDMLDYPVGEATIDVLGIPAEDSGAARAHAMYVACARNAVIKNCMEIYQSAHIPLSVIDIRETAQRNIAALFEESGRGLALVYFADDWGLLTITYRTELYLVRRMDIGWRQLGGSAGSKEAFERVALELQRTFDHFDRQFRQVPLAKLLIAPTPGASGLVEHLAANLTLPVASLDLSSKLAFETEEPDTTAQWRYFHHFGAALRDEGKALERP
jgi:MSHA biogenesis protein MshI